MKAYIRSTGVVSPQETFGIKGFPQQLRNYNQPYLKVVDPDYKQFISSAAARRMGKIIKMGVAAAISCLSDAGEKNPDAIITGTGMGCVEDTERFLISILENNEQLLTPTSFIQSTHNTIGGQIALLLTCYNYNFTYVHRGYSFESALLDGIMFINEGSGKSVLVGGVDEMTQYHFNIYKKLDHWKEASESLSILDSGTTGTLPGEGSAFFLLRDKPEPDSIAAIEAMKMVYKPASKPLSQEVKDFLLANNTEISEIDLLVSGVNGHLQEDSIHKEMADDLFPDIPAAGFKHLSGEYPTASAFGLWFAATAVKEQMVPEQTYLTSKRPEKVNKVLFCNNFRDDYFSLILLSSC